MDKQTNIDKNKQTDGQMKQRGGGGRQVRISSGHRVTLQEN